MNGRLTDALAFAVFTIFVCYLITVSAATINKQSKSSTNLESGAVSLTNGSSTNTNTNTNASTASLETNSTADADFITKSRIWRSQEVDDSKTTDSSNTVAEADSKNGSGEKATIVPQNLIEKIVSILRRRPTQSQSQSQSQSLPLPPSPPNQSEPNKQLFGGRLPPFIERIIQRIQNYFSVYNPPEYFENNRPSASPIAQNEGITIICSNSSDGSVSCNEMNSASSEDNESEAEICDSETVESSNAQSSIPADEYNVVVTHTVQQDSLLNVYSPAAESMQMVSNVVVILEPSMAEYSPPAPAENSAKNKFYVYVNPTKNQPKNTSARPEDQNGGHQTEILRPYVNTTYTVIVRGDKLEEYSTNMENLDNSAWNPDIAIYVKNFTNTSRKCKPSTDASACSKSNANTNTNASPSSSESNAVASRSVTSGSEQPKTKSADNRVPSINLMLVPPDDRKSNNKSCSNKQKLPPNTPNLEYYVLKPDNGNGNANANANKIQDDKQQAYYLQKAQIDAISGVVSQTYLPPGPDQQTFPSVANADDTTISPSPSANPNLLRPGARRTGSVDKIENDENYSAPSRPLVFNLLKNSV